MKKIVKLVAWLMRRYNDKQRRKHLFLPGATDYRDYVETMCKDVKQYNLAGSVRQRIMRRATRKKLARIRDAKSPKMIRPEDLL